jgi:hypothetical protein
LVLDLPVCNRAGGLVGDGLVHVAAAEEAEGVGEAARVRMEAGGRAEVPLADGAGGVAGVRQQPGQQRLGDGQSDLGVFGQIGGVGLVAEALLVAAGEKPGAGGAAVGVGHVAVREADAVFGERVDVRRRDVGAAVEADVRVAEVVGDDHDDVGAGGRPGRGKR